MLSGPILHVLDSTWILWTAPARPWCYITSMDSCTDATVDQWGNIMSYLACSDSPDPDPEAWPEPPNVECERHNEGTFCMAADSPGTSSNSIAISLVHGAYRGKMSARPGWVQYRFPAVPGAAAFQLRYDLDQTWGYEDDATTVNCSYDMWPIVSEGASSDRCTRPIECLAGTICTAATRAPRPRPTRATSATSA